MEGNSSTDTFTTPEDLGGSMEILAVDAEGIARDGDCYSEISPTPACTPPTPTGCYCTIFKYHFIRDADGLLIVDCRVATCGPNGSRYGGDGTKCIELGALVKTFEVATPAELKEGIANWLCKLKKVYQQSYGLTAEEMELMWEAMETIGFEKNNFKADYIIRTS